MSSETLPGKLVELLGGIGMQQLRHLAGIESVLVAQARLLALLVDAGARGDARKLLEDLMTDISDLHLNEEE